jgi:hypothetical protein
MKKYFDYWKQIVSNYHGAPSVTKWAYRFITIVTCLTWATCSIISVVRSSDGVMLTAAWVGISGGCGLLIGFAAGALKHQHALTYKQNTGVADGEKEGEAK